MKRKRLSIDVYLKGILERDTVILSQAITLIESTKPEDEKLATELMSRLPSPVADQLCFKIGITGVPGVGKSTFIDTFGMHLLSLGLKIAVLSVDPSSQRTRGSILGDKTRMEKLSLENDAYIRPSPSGSTLGGVAHKTHESIVLCEAAGFDCIIVETVGVGQSETMVRDMVDFFLLLMLAGGGDELQGIKRGIMEMADMIVIHKADGDNIKAAKKARVSYQNALHLFPPHPNGWIPPVQLCSSLENTGVAEIQETIDRYKGQTIANGFLYQNRITQSKKWFENLLQHRLLQKLYRSPSLGDEIRQTEKKVVEGEMNVPSAVGQFVGKIKTS
ncbi:MAG: methylmalonyl Co-A mutase-associated GTPase MeaB [Cyclobacteriaceae bacterium]